MSNIQNSINNAVGGTITGTTNQFLISNDSDTGGSIALEILRVGGSSAGDPYHSYQVTGGSSYQVGIDNSDSDSYVISTGASLGSTNVMRIANTGEITFPLQSAFLAYLATSQTNKTGAGTQYNIGTDALTEVFDQNSDFNTNGTFTAPVTGKYFLEFMCQLTALTAAMTNVDARIVTSNRSYELMRINPGACKDNNNTIDIGRSALTDMDAADTATYFVIVSNGAGDNATVSGSSVMITSVSGHLAC